MSNGGPTISAGQVPRQPTYWDDLTTVTKIVQLDGTYAPGTAAILYTTSGLPYPGVAMQSAAFSLSSTGTVVTNLPFATIRAYAVKLICTGASTVVNWKLHGSADLEGAQSIVAGSGYVEAVAPPAFLFEAPGGLDLDLAVSGGGTAAGRISYWIETL